MGRKILVVGGVAGGASAAARVRRLDSEAEITMFERGEHVSFSNCALPYHLSGTVAKSESLVLMTPAAFRARHDIEARVNSEVEEIRRADKTVVVRNLLTDERYEARYDKLVLAPGAKPVRPRSIRGVDGENVFVLRNVADARRLKSYVDGHGVRNVAVAGGGFVGLEVAENLRLAGLNVSVIEGAEQILAPFDYDLVQILHKELMDKGVALHLSAMLTAIAGNEVAAVQNGRELRIPAEAVVLAIGMAPESALAAKAGLAVNERGYIRVNHNYQTSDADIYAVGDAVESYDRLAHRCGNLALAGPAQRQARAAADHICGLTHNNRGYLGSCCLRVFEQNAACTGLNEKSARRAGIPCDFAYLLPPDKVSIMPQSSYMAFKLLFETPTGRVLGAQAIGKGDVVGRVNAVAAAISLGATLEDLKELELCYSPVFGTAKDVVNQAALVGLNLLHGRFRQVHVDQVRGLVESGARIVDVREPNEYEAGHLRGAVNIPLTQFKARLGEIPRDVPVYLHCRSGQRSYYALCRLLNSGYDNARNISGSFLGTCLYEYFNDVSGGRTPIVTAYNFK